MKKQYEKVTSSVVASERDIERGIRPAGFPPIEINFKEFVKQLNDCLVNQILDPEELNRLYQTYKSSQYSLRLSYVKSRGYYSVSKWAEFFCESWRMDECDNSLIKNKNLWKR